MESLKIGRIRKMPKLRGSIYSFTQIWQNSFGESCGLGEFFNVGEFAPFPKPNPATEGAQRNATVLPRTVALTCIHIVSLRMPF